MKVDNNWESVMSCLSVISQTTGWVLIMDFESSRWCKEGEYILSEYGGYSHVDYIWEAVNDFIIHFNL